MLGHFLEPTNSAPPAAKLGRLSLAGIVKEIDHDPRLPLLGLRIELYDNRTIVIIAPAFGQWPSLATRDSLKRFEIRLTWRAAVLSERPVRSPSTTLPVKTSPTENKRDRSDESTNNLADLFFSQATNSPCSERKCDECASCGHHQVDLAADTIELPISPS